MNSLVWEEVGTRIQVCFDEVRDRVCEANPALVGRAGWTTSLGHRKFHAALDFMYDPAQQEYEDLILSLFCGAAERKFWTVEGEPRLLDAAGRDAIGFEIERGTGEVLAALDPVVLAFDENTPEYERAVREYAENAISFVHEQMDLILAALAE